MRMTRDYVALYEDLIATGGRDRGPASTSDRSRRLPPVAAALLAHRRLS